MYSLIKHPSGREATLPAHVADGMWLPPATPYGNLQLKYMKLQQRLGHANLRLSAAYTHWTALRSNEIRTGIDHGSLETFNAEEAVASMRRAADELIALESLLTSVVARGEYPKKIERDSIGLVDSTTSRIYAQHEDFLQQLNEVANAHKHSFLQTSVNHFGAEEPCVTAYPLTRNRLSADNGPYTLRLSGLVDDFTAFYATAHNEIDNLAAKLGT